MRRGVPSSSWKPLVWPLVAVLLVACGSTGIQAPVAVHGEAAPPRPSHYSVHRGDTLYSIAWRYNLDYRALARWNGIRETYLIHPGQRLRLSPPVARHAPHPAKARAMPPPRVARAPRPAAPRSRHAPVNAPRARPAKHPAPPKVAARSERAATDQARRPRVAAAGVRLGPVRHWHWPAQGPIVRAYAQNGNKGLDIGGRLGQPVYSAAPGRVVYSGSGLIGYGKLIIIKHNKSHLSAYGHNARLRVKEGDNVAGGQRIADMGRSSARRVELHFEIRRDGRPVDPLKYLPRRRG